MEKSKQKQMIIVAVGAIAVLVLVNQLIRWGTGNDGNVIRVSGNVEVTEAEVSFKIAGRVVERLVGEGESVEKGQTVARLDDSELSREAALRRAEVQAAEAALAELEAGSRPEEIAQAEAAERRAQSRLEEMETGSRPEEITAAEATLAQAEADAVRWRAEHERALKLHEEGVISSQQLDVVRSNYEMAEAKKKAAGEQKKLVEEGPRKEQVEQARASWQEASQRYQMIKAGPRKETIAQARARLEQVRQALAAAQTRLGYATLLAPLTGVVLSENIEAGEFVSPGTPVVTMGELSQVWLRAYINETDLGRVKVGQMVRLRTDTYPDKEYEGKVTFIASQAEFTPRNVQTPQERVKLVYRVKIDVPNPQGELKPGMPADAEIVLGAGE